MRACCQLSFDCQISYFSIIDFRTFLLSSVYTLLIENRSQLFLSLAAVLASFRDPNSNCAFRNRLAVQFSFGFFSGFSSDRLYAFYTLSGMSHWESKSLAKNTT